MILGWSYVWVCFVCVGLIAYDIAFNRRRQQMGVMNAVYLITALYLGPVAVALYWRWGRAPRHPPGVGETAIGDDGDRGQPLRLRVRPGGRAQGRCEG
jgi:hypothetical protein